MRARRKKNNTARFISCIFMMLALAWLTISLPLVFSAQQSIKQKEAAAQTEKRSSPSKDTGNPLTNTTEEKTPSGSTNLSEEYLHDSHSNEHFTTELSFKYYIKHCATYIAFYGDLETPPPDQA